MVGPFRAETDTGSVAWPDPAAFRLPAWNLQPFLAPDPFHPLVVDNPARRAAQESRHLPIAQTAMHPDQVHKVVRQLFLVFLAPRDFALRRPMLSERRTGPALGDRQSLPDVRDARPAPRGAQ